MSAKIIPFRPPAVPLDCPACKRPMRIAASSPTKIHRTHFCEHCQLHMERGPARVRCHPGDKMILVRIELHSAITGEATHLGTMMIANDGTGNNEFRNYDAALITKDLKRGRSAKVLNHPSPRVSVWYLVAKAIKALYRDAPGEILTAPDAGDWMPGRVS